MTLCGDTRSILFLHPPATVEFPALRIGAGARLSFGIGVRQTCWDRIRSPVIFRVDRLDGWRRRTLLFEFALDPARRTEHRRWIDVEVPLGGPHDRLRLLFSTSLPPGADSSYAWAGWSDPLVLGAYRPAPRRRRVDERPNVILITVDALRPDMLGCYGHPTVETPNLDRLAADGLRFALARTPSPATIPAYACLLSGRHPASLGLTADWGTLPAGELHVARAFRSAGYETILAPSERDHLGQNAVGSIPFDLVLPVLGRPDQDGAVTTRRLLEALETTTARPKFVWIQYFDCHPPPRLPQPDAVKYDRPTRGATSGSPLRHILRANESLLEITRALPRLRRGLPDVALAVRLAATADALEHHLPGPDLASHLTALSQRAETDAALRVRPAELRDHARRLFNGTVPGGLVPWLEAIEPHLREIEAELLLPMETVESMDDLRRTAWASVSYVDRLVGLLLQGLAALGLEANSTIVFTSPHGEAFGERGLTLHHHALIESCLRVPLVLRPAASLGAAHLAGRLIHGPFSLLDLPATILAAHGLAVPPQMESTSRWSEILESDEIAPHDSFTIGPYGTQAAIVNGRWKLIHALHDHWLSDEWSFRRGETRLYRLDRYTDEDDSTPDESLVRAMDARLMEWLRLVRPLG